MVEPQWTLRLTLEDPFGQKSYSTALPIDAFDVRERFVGLTPPSEFDLGLGAVTMDRVVLTMRKREYRKEDFRRAAERLATKLGERMEDEEGWHGTARQETYAERRKRGDV